MLLLLPPEIAVRILCFLELPDLMRMHQVHSHLREYIQSFHILQYRIATQSAYVEDNPTSTLPISERLKLMRKLERGIYDLTGGIYLSSDDDGHTLHYVQLPSKKDDLIEWKSIDAQKPVVDIGLSVLEHDLLAAITSYVHEVQLLQLSTGKVHPRAQVPVLFLADSRQESPTVVAIEIVGVNLVLIITHNISVPASAQRNHIYMFDWTSGELKLKFDARRNTYSGIVLLTPELVLLPNMREFAFEIWAIPSGPCLASTLPLSAAESERKHLPNPLVSLGLPILFTSYYNSELSCRAEPNPTVSPSSFACATGPCTEAMMPPAKKPFRAAPDEALIICNILVSAFHNDATETWTMFSRRSDMLAAVMQAMETSGRGPDHDSANGGGTRDTSTGIAAEKVAYERWGPDITRWLRTARHPASWITTSAGTRCVHALRIPRGPARLRVLDFNPFAVRRACGADVQVVRDEGTMVSFPFSHPFSGKLGYTLVPFVPEGAWEEEQDAWDFDALLMDEERLVGLKTDPDTDLLKEIIVMHIGEEASVQT
ncbi:hypothetical protein H0H81_001103 [Sphagnurus paluster]|uniref:F-box domain-containing protein n=1 Tax=Sphagnurus paluster TaxID=117069 RepID=A0A9P7FP52_9AGAR|nr:hypothetical protein H0H81_001103 [Sphagnurus paluster]